MKGALKIGLLSAFFTYLVLSFILGDLSFVLKDGERFEELRCLIVFGGALGFLLEYLEF